MKDTIEVRDGKVAKSRAAQGWKFATKEFLKCNPKAGYIIKKEWLLDQFGLNEPTSWTRKEWEEFNFKFLANMDKFREVLLEEHYMDIVKVPKVGWEVIHPRDQTSTAMNEGLREIARVMNRTTRRVLNVDRDQLTVSGKKENVNALAKLQVLHTAISKHRRLSHVCYRALDSKLKKLGYKPEAE